MEYIALILGVIVGVTVAFFCMMFYRQGVKDGKARADGKAVAPLVEKPLFSKPAAKEERTPSKLASYLGANGDN